jgi:hypothetical protein
MEDLYTDNYIVTISDDTSVEDRYICSNRKTGVVEFRDHLLPRVIDTLLHLEKNLTISMEKWESSLREKDISPLRLVSEEEDGSGNLH